MFPSFPKCKSNCSFKMGRRICAWIALGPSPGLEQEEVCGGRIDVHLHSESWWKGKTTNQTKTKQPLPGYSFPAKHLCVWWVRLRSARCIQCDSSEHLASGVLEVVTAKITSLPVSTGGENGLGLTHRGDLLLGVCSCIRSWLSEVQTNPFCFYFRFSLLEDAVIFLPLLKKRFY